MKDSMMSEENAFEGHDGSGSLPKGRDNVTHLYEMGVPS